MEVILQLVNETTLPDGGPVSCRISGQRGIDIGRAAHLDWTLPDPTRYISSKHCEIRYANGGYWLHDVSTNGTFLNGAQHRMHEPHQLRNGDRFLIGHYIVAVTIEGEEQPTRQGDPGTNSIPPNDQEIWADTPGVAPPINPKELRAERNNPPVHPDFLNWSADVPDPSQPPTRASAKPNISAAPAPKPMAMPADMDWAEGRPSHVAERPLPPPPMPVPRRPRGEANESDPWLKASPFVPNAAPPATVGRTINPERTTSGDSVESVATGDFLGQIIEAAGLPDDILAQKNAAELAQQIGSTLRLCVENLMQLLSARQQSKRHARSSSHTLIQPTDNNPLKFCPSANDALRIMFGPRTSGYLDAERTITQSFGDLKVHQIKTYAAMQHALTALMADLDPKAIDGTADGGSGIGGLLQSRKAKLWDAYQSRWEAKIGPKGADPVEAFMRYFIEYYDRDGG
jgi:type VI secretion system protein ImpI